MSDRNEIEELERLFRLKVQKVGEIDFYTVPIQKLLDPEECSKFLDQLSSLFGNCKKVVAASQFAKRYSALFLVPVLYSLSVYDRGLHVEPKQIWFKETGGGGNQWNPNIIISEGLFTEKFRGNDRKQWYEEKLKQLFAGHFTPLWSSLSEASGLKTAVLWENTAVRIFSLYEKKIYNNLSIDRRFVAEEDFRNILSLNGRDFFGLNYNPVAEFYNEPAFKLDGTRETRRRKTCCFYYKVTSPAEYCDACPCKNRI